jgi:hypothetical protein
MCFSAGASFAGGIIISGIGVATIREVHKPSQLVFASIPIFFGVQQILPGLGLSLSLYYVFCLLSFHVTPQILGYHVQYNTDFPDSFAILAFVAYLIVTITPLLVSGIKRTHLLGIFMFLSCLITAILFTQYLIFVWCFFAALISAVIFWILRDSKNEFYFKKLSLLKISSDL